MCPVAEATSAEVEAAAREMAKKNGLDPDQLAYVGEPQRLGWNYYIPVGGGVPTWHAFADYAFMAISILKGGKHG